MFYATTDIADPDIQWFKKNPGRLYRFRKVGDFDGLQHYIMAYQVVPELVLSMGVNLPIRAGPPDAYTMTSDSSLQRLAFQIGGEEYLDRQDELHETAARTPFNAKELILRQLP